MINAIPVVAFREHMICALYVGSSGMVHHMAEHENCIVVMSFKKLEVDERSLCDIMTGSRDCLHSLGLQKVNASGKGRGRHMCNTFESTLA